MPKKNRAQRRTGVDGIIGLGLDNQDGEKRITRTEEMILLGGSAETHERMQETAIRFSEQLEHRGKSLRDVSLPEAVELLREAHERAHR